MDEDSDDDDDEPEILGKMEDIDDKDVRPSNKPEEANELTEGVDRIKVRLWLPFLSDAPSDQICTAQAPKICRARGIHTS